MDISRDLTFDAEHNERCVDIPISQDQLHENAETLSVILSGEVEATILSTMVASCAEAVNVTNITFATARVTILDDGNDLKSNKANRLWGEKYSLLHLITMATNTSIAENPYWKHSGSGLKHHEWK